MELKVLGEQKKKKHFSLRHKGYLKILCRYKETRQVMLTIKSVITFPNLPTAVLKNPKPVIFVGFASVGI